MPTIKDIAQKAGVSVSTVSNVINNKTSVNSEIFKRVHQVMEELNYFPNMLARNLKSNKTKFIGVVVPDLDGIYAQMIDGLLRVFDGSEYNLLIKKTDNFKNIERKIISDLIMVGVKGLFLVTCDQKNTARFDSIIKTSVPIVFLERIVPGMDYTSVTFDNVQGVYQTTRHILERDDTACVALFTGPQEFSAEGDCVDGFLSACKESNTDGVVLSVQLNKQQAFSEILDFLRDRKIALPDYVIATNPLITRALYEVIAVLGLGPVRTCTLNGDDWYGMSAGPTNTNIHRNAIHCGEVAAQKMQLFFKYATTYENEQIVLPYENYPEERRPALTQKGSLRVLFIDGPTARSTIKLLPNFTTEYGIKVEYELCANHEDLYSAIRKDQAGGSNCYDVFMLDDLWLRDFAAAGYLSELRPYIDEDGDGYLDNFMPHIRSTFVEDSGSVKAIPVVAGSQMLLYRKDLFENETIKRDYFDSVGIELKPPKTWSEYNLIARFFTRSMNARSPVEYGTCLMGYNPHGLIEEFIPRLWAYNGSIVEKDRVRIASVQSERALKNLCECYQYSYPEISTLIETEQLALFTKGNIAMVSNYSIQTPSMYNIQFEKLVTSLGIAMLPGKRHMLGEWLMAVNHASKKQRKGYAFIKWLTCDKLSIHSTTLGGFIPKKRVLNNVELNTLYPWKNDLEKYISQCTGIESVFDKYGRLIPTAEIVKVLGNGIEAALYGTQEPHIALKTMEETLRKLMHLPKR